MMPAFQAEYETLCHFSYILHPRNYPSLFYQLPYSISFTSYLVSVVSFTLFIIPRLDDEGDRISQHFIKLSII